MKHQLARRPPPPLCYSHSAAIKCDLSCFMMAHLQLIYSLLHPVSSSSSSSSTASSSTHCRAHRLSCGEQCPCRLRLLPRPIPPTAVSRIILVAPIIRILLINSSTTLDTPFTERTNWLTGSPSTDELQHLARVQLPPPSSSSLSESLSQQRQPSGKCRREGNSCFCRILSFHILSFPLLVLTLLSPPTTDYYYCCCCRCCSSALTLAFLLTRVICQCAWPCLLQSHRPVIINNDEPMNK